MCRASNHNFAPASRRAGLTLLELVLAMTVSTILVAALSVLASATRQTADFSAGQASALQHGRVVLDRISRFVNGAYATETYPGVVVVDETVSSNRYPDTLVIWNPANGVPSNVAGPPLVRELVIIAPDPNDPKRLVEFTAPTDARTVQLNDASLNTSSGRTFITSIKTASTTTKTLLTPLLRTAATTTNGNTLRAAVRFECELHPTAAEITSFRNNSLAWEDLPWPQGIFSSSTGMRQVWLRTELQLVSKDYTAAGTLPADAVGLPFLGSATLYYNLTK
ncbi:MAG: prepilin-type N-terminal cleavage/methylation domain-containing protein [Pirellulales bacterium]